MQAWRQPRVCTLPRTLCCLQCVFCSIPLSFCFLCRCYTLFSPLLPLHFFHAKPPPPPLLHAQQYPPTHRPPDSGVFCHPCRRTITCEPQTCNLRRLRMQQPTAQLLGSPLMCTLNEERSAASKCCVVNKDDFSGHASAALSLGWPRAA